MEVVQKTFAQIIRESKSITDLCVNAAKDLPSWITPKHLGNCMEDEKMQENWKPKIGDWYFCKDLYKIMQITSLARYYSDGDEAMRLPTDSQIGSMSKNGCDIYIQAPLK